MGMIAAACQEVAQDKTRQKEEVACTFLVFSLPALLRLVGLLFQRQLTDTNSCVSQWCYTDLTHEKREMRASA